MRRGEKIDIHDHEKRLKSVVRRLARSLSKHNFEILVRFYRHLRTEGLSIPRIKKYLETLGRVAKMLGKHFDEATREDIENVVYRIETSDYSPYTKHDYKVVIKRFYKWLKGGDKEYPPEVSWIKTTMKMRDELLPEDLLTEEDVMKLVNAVDHPRDKAFIITLYETAARIGEIASLRIRDIQFRERYAVVMIRHSKTGPRRIIVVAAAPYLLTWIQHHPHKDNPDAPLWVNIGTVNKYKPAKYSTLAKILKTAAEKAGFKRRIHPHIFRHSRATFLAKHLTEAQMCKALGWRQGSRMPSIYVHLSGRDVDDALLGIYGLRRPKDGEPKLKPKVCPRCGALNQIDAMFCSKCGLALDIKAAMQMEKAKRRIDAIMNKLMEDEEFRTFMMKKIQELGLV